jgi:hypothetical protein
MGDVACPICPAIDKSVMEQIPSSIRGLLEVKLDAVCALPRGRDHSLETVLWPSSDISASGDDEHGQGDETRANLPLRGSHARRPDCEDEANRHHGSETGPHRRISRITKVELKVAMQADR